MKKIKLILNTSLFLFTLFFFGCEETESTMVPIISATANELGASGTDNEVQVTVGTDVVYEFDVQAETEIKKIEIWRYQGSDVSKSEPTIDLLLEYPSVNIGSSYSFKDTVEALDVDVRYSIYVQDMYDSYNSAQVNLFIDVTRYSTSLTDGMFDGSSPTFLNVESGRTLYVANTISDPAGIDFGFAYFESESTVKACLVSFNEYYKTGNYAMVVNENNNTTVFKDASAISEDYTHIYDAVENASQLSDYFAEASDLPSALDFTSGQVAPDLLSGDIIAFKTEDSRYGLIQVTAVDDKAGSLSNDQTISFDVIVQKRD
tara:strand:+ start:16945 stop:17898 length:954 start_codon:yes stop_codon:yes gene_type:complete